MCLVGSCCSWRKWHDVLVTEAGGMKGKGQVAIALFCSVRGRLRAEVQEMEEMWVKALSNTVVVRLGVESHVS